MARHRAHVSLVRVGPRSPVAGTDRAVRALLGDRDGLLPDRQSDYRGLYARNIQWI